MRWMNSKDGVFAYGVSWGYLVVRGETDVRLSRFSVDLVASNLTAAVAAETMRNVVVFPLGRGPGRPGGEPELAALTEAAKGYAERYEAGESLEGYPAWQHRAAEVPPSPAADPSAPGGGVAWRRSRGLSW